MSDLAAMSGAVVQLPCTIREGREGYREASSETEKLGRGVFGYFFFLRDRIRKSSAAIMSRAAISKGTRYDK